MPRPLQRLGPPGPPCPQGPLRRADAGAVLPLATLAGLVMVLSSLSLLGTALASRQALTADLRRRQGEDALNSAAQLVAAQLLLGSTPAASLQVPSGEGSATVQLLSWNASADSALIQLQVQNDPAAAAGSQTARTGSFRLSLDPGSALVRGLRQEGP
ncbi:hypothetical protein [Cyanobium sp. Morenito 9A2]|uniref:hypothetical protein n=1 Tax=Cyanobium sp. Morenito 9A2 TaxID=2823718 RepID=UPI0020CE4590|nr:hypothetical protein [Cyanobium sp. Morenito 9A2]MCP9848805.1 hypothetical protein [Cyanobium sp. Morenito 9A2]